ncbi:hypothetical protein CDD83_10070 [Cordyceps sp. RAO-2017]|nr:hypothetical protein CDD83_10070 [Cordyceps sp. RAO-2017]
MCRRSALTLRQPSCAVQSVLSCAVPTSRPRPAANNFPSSSSPVIHRPSSLPALLTRLALLKPSNPPIPTPARPLLFCLPLLSLSPSFSPSSSSRSATARAESPAAASRPSSRRPPADWPRASPTAAASSHLSCRGDGPPPASRLPPPASRRRRRRRRRRRPRPRASPSPSPSPLPRGATKPAVGEAMYDDCRI